MKLIHLFSSTTEYEDIRTNNYEEPWVSYTLQDKEVNFNKSEEEKKLGTPLTYVMLSDGNITCTDDSLTIEYKLNNGEWTSITSTTGGTTVPVVSGDTVQFRGNNSQYGDMDIETGQFRPLTQLFVDGLFKVKGNIMSMINSTNFSTLKTFGTDSWCSLTSFFSYCTGLTDASELLLPATTLGSCCYAAMFEGCTSLTQAPELPATTLARDCYAAMFADCTSLTQAPALPATTLAESCYRQMFEGCTSLTTAPELPATTLVNDCYYYMFYGCTNLTYIKCLATTNVNTTKCYNWVYGVASTGTFVKAPNMTSWTTGINGIPTGWTVQDAN